MFLLPTILKIEFFIEHLTLRIHPMKKHLSLYLLCLLFSGIAYAQNHETMVDAIVQEASDNSQLELLGQELMDGIGPRLVGTPQMQQANEWAVKKYNSWGIAACNEKWGEWKGWQRGITHVDMVHPRIKSLEAMQLAWSPGTKGKSVSGEVLNLPVDLDSVAFQNWLPSVKGKFVMVSMQQPTGRPDENWEEYGTEESVEKMKEARTKQATAWYQLYQTIGYTGRTLPIALENAGAIGILSSNWSRGFGVNKIFGAYTKKVPSIDIGLEDYGLLYRLVASGVQPKINVRADSKFNGNVPTFNTIAEIRGTEKPDEYVILSAHFDSWDGGTGATDNGTGTIMMMEAMRILKLVYPNPKRTILVGHWGSEEQGLNGSRAFVEDHPEIIEHTQAVFNQDNGTGRVVDISGQGFLHSYDYISRWLYQVPDDVKDEIKTNFPGSPAGGGSDYAAFLAAGVPAFSLSSTSWDYGKYTWHTNRDTYDKIVFDDVKSNVILVAILAYMASEDPEVTSREKIVMPTDKRTNAPMQWPTPRSPTRLGGVD